MADNITLGVALALAVIVALAFEFSGSYIGDVRPEPIDLTRNSGIVDHPLGITLLHNLGPARLRGISANG